MIRRIEIENYKSIQKLDLDLGRVTVLIGENGSGKSNILEAIGLASAASQDKLDNEFLAARGIRVTDPRFMQAAFLKEDAEREIHIVVNDGDVRVQCRLSAEGSTGQTRLINLFRDSTPKDTQQFFASVLGKLTEREFTEVIQKALATGEPVKIGTRGDVVTLTIKRNPSEHDPWKPLVSVGSQTPHRLPDFLIYSPENTALRTFQSEGQILPLGIKGEGLFAHLKALSAVKRAPKIREISRGLELINWFERFEVPDDLVPGERSLRIRDRYLHEGALFDQRSANEGFLFLVFYFTLFISADTPTFFAIDNVDASLNPKLCSALIKELIKLAKKHKKQAIFTTHNPAVLDGLDLNDDEQRLLVIDRNKKGSTRAQRVQPPKVVAGQAPVKLSEAFLRGYIGGLPKNF
jgi:predicted ATPase